MIMTLRNSVLKRQWEKSTADNRKNMSSNTRAGVEKIKIGFTVTVVYGEVPTEYLKVITE